MNRFACVLTILACLLVTVSCARKTQDMPVTMNLYYTGSGGSARAFVEEMLKSGTVDKIRSEEGNLRYEYFFSQEDPETVLLIDSWESQEALDRHHATPMMETIASLREKYNLHMRAERYQRTDNPASDEQFLRK